MDLSPQSAYSLDGRLAVVTGAASGIGRQTAITLSQAGAKVIAADINGAALAELARETAGNISGFPLDVSQKAQMEALADHASGLGAVTIWVNAAGIINAPTLVTDADEETIDRVHAINVKGSYWGCAAAGRLMCEAGHGSIINISSAGADIPAQGLSIYAMTKSAVNMLTRTLAMELGPYGVRVNAVAPGFIDTPMVSYRFTKPDGSHDEEAKKALYNQRAASTPLNRIGTPVDIALAILYLASDASSFMTGQILRPNGGAVMP